MVIVIGILYVLIFTSKEDLSTNMILLLRTLCTYLTVLEGSGSLGNLFTNAFTERTVPLLQDNTKHINNNS